MLIIFALMVSGIWYTNKMIYNSQAELCNLIQPNLDNIEDYSELDSEMWEEWRDCLDTQQMLHNKSGMNMFVSAIFMFLVILSWKIDHIKKKKLS